MKIKVTDVKLLQKFAWSFQERTGLDWDELFQEAALAYYEALHKYDPKRGSLSTFMYHVIASRLKLYIEKEKGLKLLYEETEVDWLPSSMEIPYWINLTEDAHKIAQIVLTTSKRFVVLNLEQVEARLITILSNKGWSQERIEKGIESLKLAYS